MKVGLRLALILFSAAVLQRGLFSQVRIAGISADVLLLVTVAAGLTGGPDRGAMVGFFAGVTLDLLVQTPLGLTALAYCVTGYLVGRTASTVVRSAWWFPMVIAAGGSAFGVLLYAVLGEVVGQGTVITGRLPLIILIVAVVNGLLSPLARRILAWAWADADIRPALR